MAAVLALASTMVLPYGTGDAAAASSSHPIVAIVVGPVQGDTSAYVGEARRLATQVKAYGAIVREVYSPNATWSRVTAAARGANLLIYLGRGRGHPGPYGSFDPRTMNGLGLNRALASGHRNVRRYGEYYLRASLRLAPGAVVILNRVPYAAGSSEPGRVKPTRSTAARRSDGYASGFIRAGAAAVFASDHSVTSIVRDLFGAKRSMQSVFWHSPWTSTRHDSSFTSSRTQGAKGILAPYTPGNYYQSVVGRLASTTVDWQRTWESTKVVGSSIWVTSIPALLSALADDDVTEIVVANGTYRVSGAANKQTNSLWIGDQYKTRSQPVTVRAETTGGVTFDGTAGKYLGGISFQGGAHHQTWDGFNFANGSPMESGVIVFGGYAGLAAPHHITLRNITIDRSVTSAEPQGHAVYFSHAVGGPHDIVLDALTVDNSLGGLKSALHFFHSEGANRNAWNVTVRRLRVSGTDQAIIMWDETLRNITIDTATITNALRFAVRYESPGARGIVLTNIASTGSGLGTGYFSSLGPTPVGLSLVDNSLN